MEEVATRATGGLIADLLKQGVIGLLAIAFALIAIFLYREKQKVEKRERDLYEKNAAKAEKWIEKYNEHAREMREVIASLVRRV